MRLGQHPEDYAPSIPLFGPAKFYRSALALVIPVMLQTLLTGLVSLVDNFMVAALGDSKMAGVNVANQINFIYIVIVNTVCMAGGIYLSQHRGARDEEGMRQAFRFKLILAVGISVLHFFICLFFAEPLIRMMLGGNAEGSAIVKEGATYLRAVALSFIPIGISSAMSTSFRDMGITKVPLLVSVSAALINTFFNWVFIYGNLGSPRLEVTGAAIATVIARLAEAAAFMAMIARKKPAFTFKPAALFRINRGLFGEILSKSGMMLFSETAWVVSETIITALYNGRGGAETVAGMAAGWTIANIMFLVFPAIHAVTNVIVGSTLGAGKPGRRQKEGPMDHVGGRYFRAWRNDHGCGLHPPYTFCFQEPFRRRAKGYARARFRHSRLPPALVPFKFPVCGVPGGWGHPHGSMGGCRRQLCPIHSGCVPAFQIHRYGTRYSVWNGQAVRYPESPRRGMVARKRALG